MIAIRPAVTVHRRGSSVSPHSRTRVARSRSIVAAALVAGLIAAAERAPAGVDVACEPDVGGQRCSNGTCPGHTTCVPRCIQHFPELGTFEILECQCAGEEDCQAVPPPDAGNICVVPEMGDQTVHLPPDGCHYRNPDGMPMLIIDGLPPGDTIESQFDLSTFACAAGIAVCSFPTVPGDCEDPGGSLGGEESCANAGLLLNMGGTGGLLGFARIINVPVSLEIHAAPRIPGNPVQSFATDMFRMFGQITGDPDFDLLRIVVGTDFGLPSPGHTTLTLLPGSNWAVDSFFDVTYRIDFVGAPGGALAGRSGSTTGTVRYSTGGAPTCSGTTCPPGFRCEPTITVNANGSIDLCCECQPIECEPLPAGDGCDQGALCSVFQQCIPRCMRHNPATGQNQVIDCVCRFPEECQPNVVGASNPCVSPDDGGTVHLPPPGCQYQEPFGTPLFIIDGLPLGDTIESQFDLTGFGCAALVPVCSFPTAPGDCIDPGGSLAGEKGCANASLVLNMSGTGGLGGFFRFINLPVSLEIHTAPRMPGDPVQSFDADMFRLFGQITGDPDFDLLRIVAGTDFGLPSPGHTTLTQWPGGNWAVDSFFDVTYRIDFVGAPGGALAGRSGSTTAVARFAMGGTPSCVGVCPEGQDCFRSFVLNDDGTIDVCCDCRARCACRGDLTLEGAVNGDDINPFVDCFINNPGGPVPDPCVCADMNEDNLLTLADVNLFVTKLLTDPDTLCP